MLHQDYGTIIIKGLCNSPNFLSSYFKREIETLTNKGFELDEITYDFREVFAIIRSNFQSIYDERFEVFKRFQEQDEILPNNKRYNYPRPDINEIELLKIKYPGYHHFLDKLTRKFKLRDFESAERAFEQVVNKAEINTRAFLNNQTSTEAYQTFKKNYGSLRDKFRIKRKATKEDCKELPRLQEGDIISFEPDYKTSAEAFSLLKKYYAVVYLEHEKYLFIDKYKVWNEETLKAEIREVENFIDRAKSESLTEACNAYNTWDKDKDEFVYLRLKGEFYQYLDIEKYPSISSIGNREALVYGRYFLFYEYLKNQLDKFIPSPPEAKTEQEQQTENDFTLSTIEDWLFEFKDKMTETDYKTLVSALIEYFDNGMFPTLSKPIQINGRPNKKLFGWALNRIFEAKGKGIEKELLQFAKQNISLFTDVQFDENNIFKSNLYKYFTTQTK